MFYKGDKVICVRKNEWVPVGTIGTVLENSDVPFVRWENGETWALRSADMKNYDDTDKTKVIGIGDRVRLIDNNNYYWEAWKLPKGAKGTIMDIRKYGSYTVRWDNWHNGHDGDISDIKDSSCLFITKDAVELLPKDEPEQKDKIKEIEVGDRVKLLTDRYSDTYWKLPNSSIGTVVSINDTDETYTVRWDNWHNGHNGSIYYIDDSSCLFVEQDEVELIAKGKEEPKYNIVLFRQGNKVIAKMTEGKKVINTTEAKCSPDDTFNFFIGSQIALQRLMAEQFEDYEDIRYPVPETTGVREFLLY